MKQDVRVQTITAALAAFTIVGILPGAAFAQGRDHRNDWRDNRRREEVRANNIRDDWRNKQNEADKRQKTKNDWRNLATASGGVAILGLLKKDPTITFAGAAGALYSLNRYEQDRKSQSEASRARANFFSQPYFYRDGNRYERRLVNQNGQKYYRFEKR